MNYTLRPCALLVEDQKLVLRTRQDNKLVATLKHKFTSDMQAEIWAKNVLVPKFGQGTSFKKKDWRVTRTVSHNKTWIPSLAGRACFQ